VQHRLEAVGGSGPLLVFAHANGFPPGSYRQFLAPLTAVMQVVAFLQRPLWSPQLPSRRLNWQHFADDLLETLVQQVAQPVWLMGHSLGATVAMLAAVQRPDLVNGLVLLDPVFLPTRNVAALHLLPSSVLRNAPMVRKALSRPDRFATLQEAFDFHRSRRAFADFSDEVLWDYIHAATRETEDGALQLAYIKYWEAAVYQSAPWVWPRLARLRQPTLGLRGQASTVLTERALARWQRLQPHAVLRTLAGGHLLPMERPTEASEVVLAFLRARAG